MKSLQELQALRDKAQETIGVRAENKNAVHVVVCMATCGIAAGARPVLSAFIEETAKQRSKLPDVVVSQTGCIGLCQYEPIVQVKCPNGDKTTYIKMTPERAAQVVEKHLIGGKPVAEFTIDSAK